MLGRYNLAFLFPFVTSHVKLISMLPNIKSELMSYLERLCFQLSNDVSYMFLGGFTHE